MRFLFLLFAAFLVAAEPVTASGLPDTGQTVCYNTSAQMTCPVPGAQLAQDGSYPGNPPAYIDNADGTVTDSNTWLLWQGSWNGPMDRASAAGLCSGLSLGGITGWRLPSRGELYAVLDFGSSSGPMMNNNFFPGTSQSCFWSGTPDAASPAAGGWVVDFGDGTSRKIPVESPCAARCVYGTERVADHVDNGDGTVVDDVNGLIWQRNAATQAMSWEAALNYCEDLTFGGFDDWRLPDIKELETLNDLSRTNPAVDAAIFPDAGVLSFWSSTTSFPPTSAASIDFNAGAVAGADKLTPSLAARCVRTRNLADASLSLENPPKTVAARAATALMLTVSNNGPDTAKGAALSGTMPEGTTLISAASTTGTCTLNGLSLACALGDMDFGMTAAVFVTMTVPSTAGLFHSSFSLTSINRDMNVGDNSAVWDFTVARIVRTLGVSIAGSGSVVGDGLSCPGDCSEIVADGASVLLGAVPEKGWALRRWSGAIAGNANPAMVSMTANRSVAAVFEPDNDEDGLPDSVDNCPAVYNPDQKNSDADGSGDACDSCPNDSLNDSDGDGICGDLDICQLDPDNDSDGDGICGNIDNCPLSPNTDQRDSDADGVGDYCSKDVDLVPVSLVSPASAAIGEAMAVEITVRNQGSHQAGRDFEASLYLSRDGILRSGDQPVRSVLMRRSGGGMTRVWRGRIAVPPDTPPGSYYLVVDADSGRLVAEVNEINNSLAGNRVEIVRISPSINSVTIQKILYNHASSELAVRASSAYGPNASLEVAGIGPMRWNAAKRYWEIRVTGLAEAGVRTITVRGVEGQAESSVVIR